MVLRGVPSLFVVVTIALHQVIGAPIGTGVIIALVTSWSKLVFVCPFQLYDTAIGVCHACGRASGLG